MKKIIFFFICVFCTNSYALDSCGAYRLNGIFKKSSNSIKDSRYVVNEGTKSEMSFKINRPLDLVKLSMTSLRPTAISVLILKKMDNTVGEISQVVSIDPGVLNSMNIGTNNMKLVKEKVCL